MLALRPPFIAKNMDDLYKRVLKGQYEPVPDYYSKEMNMLVNSCLQVNPKQRPSTEEILH
jgi:NIMA (never in mitosis gene a)-related kinase